MQTAETSKEEFFSAQPKVVKNEEEEEQQQKAEQVDPEDEAKLKEQIEAIKQIQPPEKDALSQIAEEDGHADDKSHN